MARAKLTQLEKAESGAASAASADPLSTLSSAQRDVLAIVRAGCLPSTACQCVGWEEDQLTDELARCPLFRRELLRCQAALEASHLRNVQAAAQDKKNWRASVWWLERRFPDRYGKPPCRKRRSSAPGA